MAETIDKILDKLPYSDGSLRRRFVSGGIVIVGALVISLILSSYKEEPLFIAKIKQIFETTEPTDILKSPILVGIAVLSVYALGNLVEMFGEIFLVRAAAGMFWSMSFPYRRPVGKRRSISKISIFVLKIYAVPFLIIFNVAKGIFGYTSYQIEICSSLTEKAKSYYDKKIKPEHKVAAGLTCPVGNNAETTWKHLVDQFQTDTDKMWARRSIGRVKDVLAITTALIIVFISLSVVVSLVLPIPPYPGPSLYEGQEDIIKSAREKTREQWKGYDMGYQGDPRTVDQLERKITQVGRGEGGSRSTFDERDNEIIKKIMDERDAQMRIIITLDDRIREGSVTGLEADAAKREREVRGQNRVILSEMATVLRDAVEIAEEMDVSRRKEHDRYAKITYAKRLSWVSAVAILFMYTYQAYFITQRNVIESLIETLAIKDANKTTD